jgi:hypothetical protein
VPRESMQLSYGYDLTCVWTTNWLRLSDDVNMRAEPWLGEDASMSDPSEDLAEVLRRLKEIQRRKRGRIRWGMSTRTAEIAIGAIVSPADRPPVRSRSFKRRCTITRAPVLGSRKRLDMTLSHHSIEAHSSARSFTVDRRRKSAKQRRRKRHKRLL